MLSVKATQLWASDLEVVWIPAGQHDLHQLPIIRRKGDYDRHRRSEHVESCNAD